MKLSEFSMQPAVGVRTLNMSIVRFDYLSWLTNRGRCIHPLALEIRGEKLVSEGQGVKLHNI